MNKRDLIIHQGIITLSLVSLTFLKFPIGSRVLIMISTLTLMITSTLTIFLKEKSEIRESAKEVNSDPPFIMMSLLILESGIKYYIIKTRGFESAYKISLINGEDKVEEVMISEYYRISRDLKDDKNSLYYKKYNWQEDETAKILIDRFNRAYNRVKRIKKLK